MSTRSKRKGSAYELEVVRAHHALGIAGKKTPLSGALPGYPGDVQIAGLIGECKRRKRGAGFFYKALSQGQGADVLFTRDDNQETLVVLPWATWALILQWLEFSKKFPVEPESEAVANGQTEED